jgi:four helix bundle protein
MGSFASFQDIDAWQLARHLTKNIYEMTNRGKFMNDFGLTNQLQRSAVSIMSNIAEGFEREGNKEFIHFLSIAKGSNGEVLSQLIIAKDIGYITEKQYAELMALTEKIANKLGGLIRYLKENSIRG